MNRPTRTRTPTAAAAVSVRRWVLQRWMEMGARSGASSRNRFRRGAAVGLQLDLELGRDGQADRRRARLGDLVGGEHLGGACVHPLRVGPQCQDEQHVGQVDRLPPRRRTNLQRGDVDQLQMPVAHQQVGRLDVTVGHPDVPEGPHHAKALVDDRVVDLGVAKVPGVLEELRDQHVFLVGSELHQAIRAGDPHPVVGQQAQGVVLVGGQAAHRADRGLVLELAVEDGAAEPVPAVGPLVAGGVDLAEHPAAVLQRHPQRRGASRALQPELLHLGHGQAELVGHGADDRPAALAAEVQVGGVAAGLVGDGEALLRDPPPEGHIGHARGEDRGVQHGREVVGGQQQLGQDHQHQPRREPGTEPVAAPASRQEDEGHRVQRDREGGDRLGGERVHVHVHQHRHGRARKLDEQQPDHDPVGHHQGCQEDHQVAEASVQHQDQDGGDPQGHDGGEGGEQGGQLGRVNKGPSAGPGEPFEDRLVHPLDRVARVDEDVQADADEHHRRQHPDPPGPVVLSGQRRRLTRRTAPSLPSASGLHRDVVHVPSRGFAVGNMMARSPRARLASGW